MWKWEVEKNNGTIYGYKRKQLYQTDSEVNYKQLINYGYLFALIFQTTLSFTVTKPNSHQKAGEDQAKKFLRQAQTETYNTNP